MFSILMSVYKNDSPDELQESYNSLLNQNSVVFEIVLVCDGPLGNELSNKVLDFEFKALEENITFRCIRLENNLGLGKALAIGQKHCKCDYIVRMDSDDISLPGRLEALSHAVNENPEVDVIGAQIEEFETEPGDLRKFRIVPCSHEDIYAYSKLRNPMNHVTVCIKHSALIASGGYEDMLWHEDYYLWIKMLRQGYRFMNLNQVHVAVRISDIGGRRSGLRYIRAEWGFLNAKYSTQHFSFIDKINYMLPRLIVRLMPSVLTGFLYKKLRKSM